MTSESLDGEMDSILTRNATYVGSIHALGAIFPISPMTSMMLITKWLFLWAPVTKSHQWSLPPAFWACVTKKWHISFGHFLVVWITKNFMLRSITVFGASGPALLITIDLWVCVTKEHMTELPAATESVSAPLLLPNGSTSCQAALHVCVGQAQFVSFAP